MFINASIPIPALFGRNSVLVNYIEFTTTNNKQQLLTTYYKLHLDMILDVW